jgi:hypothetical protein
MAYYTEVNLDPAALDWLLNDPAGPVGVLIAELTVKAAGIAKANAPVMVTGTRWPPSNLSHWGKYYNPERQYGPPGMTKAGTYGKFPMFNGLGQLYGGVNAPRLPTAFLTYGGGRYGNARLHPFMTQALNAVTLLQRGPDLVRF